MIGGMICYVFGGGFISYVICDVWFIRLYGYYDVGVVFKVDVNLFGNI